MRELHREIKSHLANEKKKPFLVSLPSEIAMGLSIWLSEFSGNEKNVWDWDKGISDVERFLPIIKGRLNKAIEESESEINVEVELSYREINILGIRLYQFKSNDPELFLALNQAFVEAGGKDNQELRRAFEFSQRK